MVNITEKIEEDWIGVDTQYEEIHENCLRHYGMQRLEDVKW